MRDARAKGRILARLLRLENGNFGDHKAVGEGVFELRIDCGPGYRVYFGLDGSEIVVLLGGGDKGSQEADIRAAKERWADYNA